MRKRVMPLRLWHTAARYGNGQGSDEFVPSIPYRHSQATDIRPPGLETHSKSLLRNSAQFLTEVRQDPLCRDDALGGHQAIEQRLTLCHRAVRLPDLPQGGKAKL